MATPPSGPPAARRGGRLPALRLRGGLRERAADRRGVPRHPAGRRAARRPVGDLETVERQARPEGRRPRVRAVAEGPPVGLPGPLPRALAVPELPPPRVRRPFPEPRREAVPPRGLPEDVARDGAAGRDRAGGATRAGEPGGGGI